MKKEDQNWFLTEPRKFPGLAPEFRPAVLANRRFRAEVARSGQGEPLTIAVEADNGTISSYKTAVFAKNNPRFESGLTYVERIVKFLLWQRGGWRVVIGGPAEIGKYIGEIYSKKGKRAFDADLMAEVYSRPFTVETTTADKIPPDKQNARPLGRHLEGCRIGFDLGASDRKVAAIKDGQAVFSEEVVWDPKGHSDPQYHFDEIMAALKKAAGHLPRVDAIGGSAAGIYINNSVRIASLFRGVPRDLFEKKIRNLFGDIQKAWNNIPLEVINDGEVTALAGSMSLGVNSILGIAMGSSLAAGYVDREGNVIGWLDELAFAPVDYNPEAPVDEWSGDYGCGAMYFSQVAVNRLAARAGIKLDEKKTLAERLKDVQQLVNNGDKKAGKIFETIGVCFGYTVAHYADFYDLSHILVLGRVTSGKGGDILIKTAEDTLRSEFPDLASKVRLVVPDEASRRVGQAIAAASLPRVASGLPRVASGLPLGSAKK
jgi:predicted NBD/HSP70 family sugar kinase